MKLISLVLAITLFASAPSTYAETPEAAAESAALAWLSLVDAGDFTQSWSAASTLFRQSISATQWQSAAAGARAPLGSLKSRKMQSATLKNALPGAPDGQYVVIQFASTFEHKENAIETVTPMKDTDGNWHVSGYYVK